MKPFSRSGYLCRFFLSLSFRSLELINLCVCPIHPLSTNFKQHRIRSMDRNCKRLYSVKVFPKAYLILSKWLRNYIFRACSIFLRYKQAETLNQTIRTKQPYHLRIMLFIVSAHVIQDFPKGSFFHIDDLLFNIFFQFFLRIKISLLSRDKFIISY